jgi:Ca-activated chloride channel family protein
MAWKVAFLFWASWCAAGQVHITPREVPFPDPEAHAPPGALLTADASLVLIPAHVTNGMGGPVIDLTKENFRLFENGVEQTITQFWREDAPVSVAVLFDKSGSMKNKVHKTSEALESFFRTANPDDEFLLIEFNEHAKVTVPFTRDAGLLLAEIARLRPFGMTSLLDAMRLSMTELSRARHPRKAVVIISDGGENWSRHNFREIRRSLAEAGIQVYSLGVFDENFHKHPPEERNGPQMLQTLAAETGVRTADIGDLSELASINERLSTSMRSQYVLGYSPREAARDGSYRHVTVQVSHVERSNGLHIDYRQGYYAPDR